MTPQSEMSVEFDDTYIQLTRVTTNNSILTVLVCTTSTITNTVVCNLISEKSFDEDTLIKLNGCIADYFQTLGITSDSVFLD